MKRTDGSGLKNSLFTGAALQKSLSITLDSSKIFFLRGLKRWERSLHIQEWHDPRSLINFWLPPQDPEDDLPLAELFVPLMSGTQGGFPAAWRWDSSPGHFSIFDGIAAAPSWATAKGLGPGCDQKSSQNQGVYLLWIAEARAVVREIETRSASNIRLVQGWQVYFIFKIMVKYEFRLAHFLICYWEYYALTCFFGVGAWEATTLLSLFAHMVHATGWHGLDWVGVRWGMMTFLVTQWMGWGGVGGDDVPWTCTHGWCYAMDWFGGGVVRWGMMTSLNVCGVRSIKEERAWCSARRASCLVHGGILPTPPGSGWTNIQEIAQPLQLVCICVSSFAHGLASFTWLLRAFFVQLHTQP